MVGKPIFFVSFAITYCITGLGVLVHDIVFGTIFIL